MEVFENIPRIYTAIAEWLACMVFIFVLPQKKAGIQRIFIFALALVCQCLLMVPTGDLPLFWWIPCMLGAVFLMFLFLFFSCQIPPVSVWYCTTFAFLLAEFSASIEWQIQYFLIVHFGLPTFLMRMLLLVTVYGFVYITAFILLRQLFSEDFVISISVRELGSVLLIAVIVFALSNLSYVSFASPFSSNITTDIFNIRSLVDFAGLAVLYAYQSRIKELGAEKDLSAMNSVLKGQYDQYLRYQENIDVINTKYHDLKHQIIALRAETDEGKQKEWLDAMEKEISEYGAAFNTGSSVLDTILSGKTIYCKKHGIEITCVADGTLLSFMHVTDICSIFGNALDNAIESVIILPDKEKRLIHLSVSSQRNFVFIQIENYCESALKFENGEPVTTKSNKDYHGYGVKSIKKTVEKYGGTTTISVEKKWFTLKILIPNPQ